MKMLILQNEILKVLQCLFVLIPIGMAQLAIPLYLEQPRLAHKGLVTPARFEVTAGNEALIKLTKPLVNQLSCTISTPWGQNFTTAALPNNRYESWSDGCGVRIRNVQLTDEGRWRLTASRNDHSITGFSALHVLNASTVIDPSIMLLDSSTEQNLNLTDLPNSYCTVARPFASSELVPGHCEVRVERVSRALQGAWSVQLALPGRVAELSLAPRVYVEAERLDMGFVVDSAANKLHLYCNILHTVKNITFCRFQRASNAQGYSVSDGLGDGDYSYYGDGYDEKHCGLTVEHPSAQDYGAWRCSVGVSQLSGAQLVRSALQGLVSVSVSANAYSATSQNHPARVARETETEEGRTVLAVNGSALTVSCEAAVPLAYCWFRVRDGTGGVRDFTPGNRVEPELENSTGSEFWYTGEGLEAGDCGITIANATFDLSGAWACHMGPLNQPGLELTEHIDVRVTGHLAATRLEVGGGIGASAILECRSAEGVKPLDYCRFLSPTELGMSLDATITAANAILGRYHFTEGADLDRGVCSLTIAEVTSEDVGAWTCAALVSGDATESSDTLALVIIVATLSTAAVIGMGASALALGSALAIFGVVKVVKRRSRQRRVQEDLPMQDIARTSAASSVSGESVTHFNAEGPSSSHML